MTLTLDPKKLNGQDSTKFLKRSWAKLRSLLHRQYGRAISYICVLEYQKSGMAHLHILLNQWIDVHWLKEKWQAVGGGWNVWIALASIRRISRYIAKYLSKDLLLSAPKGSRRVTTSRDIRLFDKPTKEAVWSLIRACIDRVRLGFDSAITETFCEIEGILTTFTVAKNIV